MKKYESEKTEVASIKSLLCQFLRIP